MRTIKEYLLDKNCSTLQTVYMPHGAEVVAVKDTDRGLMLIAMADPVTAGTDLRTFKICNTNENTYIDAVRYIGSFDSLMFGISHVIEFI